MATPYTPPTLGTNYNANPPSDDGDTAEANRVKWSTIKTKLPDVNKGDIASVSAAVTTAFDKIFGNGVRAETATSSLPLTDQGKVIVAQSGVVTLTLPDVSAAGSHFPLAIVNDAGSTITVSRAGTDTINGLTSFTLEDGQSAILIGDGTATWYPFSLSDTLVNGAITPALPLGYSSGWELTHGTDAAHDIDIAAGVARSDADTGDLRSSAAIGKQIDVSWAAGGTPGTPTGGLSSSVTLSASTLYYLIAGLVSNTVEVGFDTSATGANLVTDHSFTNTYQIGWVVTDATSNIISGSIAQTNAAVREYGPVATTSGTTVLVSGLIDATRIEITVKGLSGNGTNFLELTIGDSGGIETTGYAGTHTRGANHTAFVGSDAFKITEAGAAAAIWSGHILLTQNNGTNFDWVISSSVAREDTASGVNIANGSKSLAGALDRFQLQWATADTFDAGEIFVRWWN